MHHACLCFDRDSHSLGAGLEAPTPAPDTHSLGRREAFVADNQLCPLAHVGCRCSRHTDFLGTMPPDVLSCLSYNLVIRVLVRLVTLYRRLPQVLEII